MPKVHATRGEPFEHYGMTAIRVDCSFSPVVLIDDLHGQPEKISGTRAKTFRLNLDGAPVTCQNCIKGGREIDQAIQEKANRERIFGRHSRRT